MRVERTTNIFITAIREGGLKYFLVFFLCLSYTCGIWYD